MEFTQVINPMFIVHQ